MTLHISQICRYPLKSARGESLEHAEILHGGLEGDRAFALLDSKSGKVVSAKRPKLWRGMLQLAAGAHPDTNEIDVTFPDGRILRSDSDALVQALKDFLGHDIVLLRSRKAGLRLERARPEEVIAQGLDADVTMDVNPIAEEAPGEAFQDLAAVHLITESTARAIAAAAGLAGPEIARYRPNLVIAGSDDEAFMENGWVGRDLLIGSLRLRVTLPTPRCAIPVLEQGSGCVFRPALLAAINALNRAEAGDFGEQPCAGAYARVIESGAVRLGDPVRLV